MDFTKERRRTVGDVDVMTVTSSSVRAPNSARNDILQGAWNTI